MPASRRRSTTPESAVLRACLDTLKLHGVPAWRNNVGMLASPSGRPVRFGKVGSSDVLGVLPFGGIGRIACIECKAPGKEHNLTDAQWAFLAMVHDAGGVALVISDPGRLAEILSELRDDPGRVYGLPPRPTRTRGRGIKA